MIKLNYIYKNFIKYGEPFEPKNLRYLLNNLTVSEKCTCSKYIGNILNINNEYLIVNVVIIDHNNYCP